MKFAVIGAGGIGGYFGGRLAQHGHDVHFVARGATLEALTRDGLHLESVAGDATIAPVSATDDTAKIGPVDTVLLAVKTWQLDPAIAALAPLVGPDTAVMTLQNGVEAPHQVAATIGRDAVMPGIAKIFSHIASPGRIRHGGGPASLTFGEWDDGPSERLNSLREALRESGTAVVESDDIWAELWAKFVFVVSLGGLGAAADAPVGVLRSTPGSRDLLEQAMGEITQVGRAHGIKLPDDTVASAMAFVDAQPEEGTTSLQRDLLDGRPSELEAWNGAVVRLGREAGVSTPVHQTLYETLRLRAISRGRSRSIAAASAV